MLMILSACKPKLDVPDPEKGNVDATRFVAIGGSMTAGYADGALYHEAQRYSFANILAEQLKQIGAGEFSSPYLPEGSAGVSAIYNNTTSIAAKFILSYKTDCKNVKSLSPVRLPATDNYGVFSNLIFSSSKPYNNMGVPDIKTYQVFYPGYGNPSNAVTGYFNPYYQRMASSNSGSVLGDALNQNPTFFSLCIGMNDVLSFALAGGAYDSITTQSRFDASVDYIVNQLTANGARGVIGSIPDFTKLPFFTTIPYNGLVLDSSKAQSLNSIYNPIGFDTIFNAGSNGFMINDKLASIGFRQIKEGELILLNTPLDSVKCFSFGSLIPLADRNVLTFDEIQLIKNAITNFNFKLKSTALAKGLAYVNTDALFNTITNGIIYNGVTINAQFVKGGSISLDGLQLNPIGNALLANEFIKAINSTYQSTIPYAEVTKYRGTIFP